MSCRSRNSSSVRNSPTPPRPRSRRPAAPPTRRRRCQVRGRADVEQQLHRVPVGRTARARRSRGSSAAGRRRPSPPGPTPASTAPAAAVDADDDVPSASVGRRPAARPPPAARASGPGSRCGWSGRPPRSPARAPSPGPARRCRPGRGRRPTSTYGWPGVGHARHRQAEHGRHRPVPHVVEVGDPLGQVAAGRGEQLPVRPERRVQRVRPRRCRPRTSSATESRERRVGGHQRPAPPGSRPPPGRSRPGGPGGRGPRPPPSSAVGGPGDLAVHVGRHGPAGGSSRPARPSGQTGPTATPGLRPSPVSTAPTGSAARGPRRGRGRAAPPARRPPRRPPSPSASSVTSVPCLAPSDSTESMLRAGTALPVADPDRHRHRRRRGRLDEQGRRPGVQPAVRADHHGALLDHRVCLLRFDRTRPMILLGAGERANSGGAGDDLPRSVRFGTGPIRAEGPRALVRAGLGMSRWPACRRGWCSSRAGTWTSCGSPARPVPVRDPAPPTRGAPRDPVDARPDLLPFPARRREPRPPETLAYVAAFDRAARASPTRSRVLDVDPASPSYGQVVGWTDMPYAGDELHHFGWNACSAALCPYAPHPHVERRYLVVPGLRSSRDLRRGHQGRPAQPPIVKMIEAEELAKRAGYSRPHTVPLRTGRASTSPRSAAPNGDGRARRRRAARPRLLRGARPLGGRPRPAVPGLRLLVAHRPRRRCHQRVGHARR